MSWLGDVDRLREAARLMRERAHEAMHHDAKEPGRWMTEHHNSRYHSEPHRCHIAEDRKGVYWTVAHEVYIPIAEHMAGMDPHTTLHIAAWLERAARRWWLHDRGAVAVACAYLGTNPTSPASATTPPEAGEHHVTRQTGSPAG